MPLKHENMLNRKMKSFTFINTLGEGAFAKVYEAVDERDNSQVAIKVIPKQLMKETPKLDELVKTQIRVLKTCVNDNVIHYVDSFTSDLSIFIATEFCNGGDLEHYLEAKKRLTEDQATNFLKQILNGFKGLHEVGAMHRDFKLANVLLHNGICKIADLGFAKQMEKKNLANTILGTSLTMAPEVLDEKPYGMEADLWSIGVVYYQMIYGRYPYVGLNDYDILKKIKNSRPDFSAVQISKQCRDFIDKCLTLIPKQRIKWQQVYEHPLLAKNEARFIYGALKSKISLGTNKKYYEQQRFEQGQDKYPCIDDIMNKKDLLDVNWDDGVEIRESVNAGKLIEEAKMKKERERNFNAYEKLYVNKRNNIMFIFKYICPYTDTLVKFKANHGIALFITAKRAYTDMKKTLDEVKQQKNTFAINKDWKQFTKSSIYKSIRQQFEGDLEMIEAQALSYMYDIHIKSKQIDAESNIRNVASKNWEKLVKDTVDQYWYLLSEAILDFEPKNQQQKKYKETVIRVLQALDFYRENKTIDIEQFDKIMEVLNVQEAEQKIKKKVFEAYQ